MVNALTKGWAHGTVAQYNQKEADSEKMDVSYTSNGVVINRLSGGGSPVDGQEGKEEFGEGKIALFFPITVPSSISDAVQKLEGLKLHFSTDGTRGRIESLRLLRNNSDVFNLTGPLSLVGNFLKNGMDFDADSPLFTSICLEIVVKFPGGIYPVQNNPPVIIEGAGIISKQKKFGYK
ncbi:hypothetical protein COM64_20510 [Bacillus toyonensis]|uniref:hypothetical protein n=1 Tax=Bacillus toyonensis TaxID=155322 RepID=UPI000BF7A875|nr:hypothetical protein [Bacillus toyonensis]PGE16338.1 hypothetical protein COM64_20510 [Bacillus toyonensis]